MPPLNYLQGMAGRFGRGANTLGSMVDPRQRFAQQLQMESMDTSPAFVGEGISRLGKALVGALLAKRSMEDRADASRWLTAKMPDRTRQPTEAEALEDDKLKWLQQAAMRGGPDVSQQPTRDKFATREYEDILGDFRERVPDTDDVLMGTGRIPKTLQELSVLNYLQEQHKDFPEQTEFTHPFTGAKETATAEDWVKIPKRIEEGERKFAEQMEDARQASMKYRPRDYAQELASGMEAYRSDPLHQISDPYTRMEWLRESAQGREANPFISRMLENLMFAEIARDDEEALYQRRLKDKRQDAKTASDIQESQFERTSSIQEERLKRMGWKPSTRPTSGGLTQRILINSSTGEEKEIGEPYDAKLMSEEAVKQQTQIFAGKKAALSPLQEKQIEKIDREKKKDVQEIKTIKLKDRSALQDFKRKTDTLTQTIADAESMINTFSTGALGGIAQYMPWPTDRSRLDDYLTTLKANLGFDSLQKMRENSKTGGALGNVSEMENKLLQAINGALNPKNPGVMQTNLDRIKELYPMVLAEKMQVYQDTYGEAYNKPRSGRAGDTAGGGNVDMVWDPVKQKLVPNRRQ